MGYINFSDDNGIAINSQPNTPHRPGTAHSDRLSPLEWLVVELARDDSLATLREPSRIAVAMGGVLGTCHSPRRADARFEALRRIAVLSWHYGFAIREKEITVFIDADFTLDQYELLVESVLAARAETNKARWTSRPGYAAHNSANGAAIT